MFISILKHQYKALPLPHLGQSDYIKPQHTDHNTCMVFPPNNQPWITKDVQLLLKEHNMAFCSGNIELYNAARSNLKRGISDAKAVGSTSTTQTPVVHGKVGHQL